MKNEKIVHVIDDDPHLRNGIALLLATEGFQTRTYAGAAEFLDDAASLAGGCVVTDVRMPGMTGVELLTRMEELRISLPVIVMTAYADVALAIEAMKKGAVDFLEKPFDDETLLASIGEAFVRSIDKTVRYADQKAGREKLEQLTPRERDVLAGLLEGKPNKVIAYELGIAVRTVEAYRANLMAKTQASSLAELIRTALMAQLNWKDA
jgi:two-component system response regulator FixJ